MQNDIYAGLAASLVQIGFPQKESVVYVALLRLGKGTASEIARAAHINRTTGYDILDNLIAKGLARITGKEPKQEYVAEPPDRIEKFLRGCIEQDQSALSSAIKLIPQLSTIHNAIAKPRVRFYEGVEGLMDVYEDTLTSQEPIRAYARVEDMYQGLPSYFPAYFERRAARGIKIRGIIPRTPLAIKLAEKNELHMREIAFVPDDQYGSAPEINMYDDKIMIASWREKLGIIIESQGIADVMKKIFELAWAEAKRIDEKLAAR